MRRKITTIGMLATMLAVSLAGCGKQPAQQDKTLQGQKTEAAETFEEKELTSSEEVENVAEDKMPEELAFANLSVEEQNEKAHEAYQSFLDGNRKLQTADSFAKDDNEYNMDGITFGEYSYEELKYAIAELEMGDSLTKYTFLDFGGDGIDEMVLRFENIEMSFMHWNGILHFDGEQLLLNDYYEDGYRVEASLFDNGFLRWGGSNSAGEYQESIYEFDQNGCKKELFTVKNYWSYCAVSFVYDLRPEGPGLEDPYNDITDDFVMRTYVDEDEKYFAVDSHVEKDLLSREEAMLKDFTDLGAVEISPEKMDTYFDFSPYLSETVKYLDWEDDLAPYYKKEANVYATFGNTSWYESEEDYTYVILDSSEYATDVEFSTSATITDFQVVSLMMKDVTEDGNIIFQASELYSQEELTPYKPLIAKVSFPGDTPTLGITYLDPEGIRKYHSVSLSGMDGMVMLTEETSFVF